MKKLALILACLSLAGCGDSAVDTVRNSPIKGYEAYTYGKVLDNHKVCENSEWKAYEDNAIKKVSYVCTLKKGKTSFNFDDKVANKIRQDRVNEYIENRKKSIEYDIENEGYELKEKIKEKKELEAALSERDYIKYYIDSTVYFTGKNDVRTILRKNAYGYNSPIQPFLKDALSYEVNGFTVIENAIIEAYKQKAKKGFTHKESAAFESINDIIRNDVLDALNEEIATRGKNITAIRAKIEGLRQELDDKEILKKGADKAGEIAVYKYAMVHVLRGEEVIIWSWNPVSEQYDIENQYMKQYEYGDRYTTFNLYIERVIYSAIKNTSDVDEYMARSRAIAAKELYNMIHGGNY